MDRQDVQKMGMRLLKKGHIGLVRLVFSRIGLLALLLVLQVALVLTAFILCGQYMPHLIVIQGIFVVCNGRTPMTMYFGDMISSTMV